MGRMQRRKGKTGEREAAAELGEVLGVTARRGVQYHGGPDSPDVVLEGVRIHVEAKRTETLSIYAAMDQAIADAPTGVPPLVWHRRNRRESLLVLRTTDLVRLAHEIVRVSGQPEGGGTDVASTAEDV